MSESEKLRHLYYQLSKRLVKDIGANKNLRNKISAAKEIIFSENKIALMKHFNTDVSKEGKPFEIQTHPELKSFYDEAESLEGYQEMAEDYLSDFRQEMLTTIKTRLEAKHSVTVSMKAIVSIVKIVVIFKIHERLAPSKLNRLSINWFEHYLDEKNSGDQQDQIYLNQKSHMRSMHRQINSSVAQSYKNDMASTIEDIVGSGFLEDFDGSSSQEDSTRVEQQNKLSFKFFMRAHVRLLASVIDGIKVSKLDHVHKIDARGPGLRPEPSTVILENKSLMSVQGYTKNPVDHLSEKSAMSMQ
jgi:hypothetical protein